MIRHLDEWPTVWFSGEPKLIALQSNTPYQQSVVLLFPNTSGIKNPYIPIPQASRNADLHSEKRTWGTAQNVAQDPQVIETFDQWFRTRHVIVLYSNIVFIRHGNKLSIWTYLKNIFEKWKRQPGKYLNNDLFSAIGFSWDDWQIPVIFSRVFSPGTWIDFGSRAMGCAGLHWVTEGLM